MSLGGVDLDGAGKAEDAWGFGKLDEHPALLRIAFHSGILPLGKNSTGKDAKEV